MSDANEDVDPAVGVETPAELRKMTIAEIEHSVTALPPSLSQDQMLGLIMLASVLTQRVKQIKQRVDETAIAWIKDHGPLSAGPIVYSVGKTKSVKCTDVKRCMEQLLHAAGGDIGILAELMIANPFKYGSCQEMLSTEAWASVFRQEWQDKLVLKATDTRFLPKLRRGGAAS